MKSIWTIQSFRGRDRLVASENQKKAKHNQILHAAVQVFSEKGYNGAVVADIAERAGIGKGTIYEYFRSKEELFFSVFELYWEETWDAAAVSISAIGGSATERLGALSDTMMAQWVELEDIFAIVMEFWAASSNSQLRHRFRQAFRDAYAQIRGIVSSLIQNGIERGEFRPDVNTESVAAALVGTWDALLLQAWFDDTFDPVVTAKDFLKVVINGMSTK